MIQRHILIDEPSPEDLFDGRGHQRTAVALANAIRNFDGVDRAIGLDGPWGSGKSSIVKMAENILRQEKHSKQRKASRKKYHFFTFDIWKSQGSAFRRSFLEHFLQWAQSEFKNKKSDLDEIEDSIKGKKREVETSNRPKLDAYGAIVLIILPFLPIYYFWTKSVYDEYKLDSSKGLFICSEPFLILCGFVGFTIFWARIKYVRHKKIPNIGKYNFLDALSQTLLISSRQQSEYIVTEQIREVDPNDYEFKETLRTILSKVQSETQRVVFVLDNLDRLPPDEVPEYWAQVRLIFSQSDRQSLSRDTSITAIVPYAHDSISSDLSTNYNNREDLKSQEDIDNFNRERNRELVIKTFDEILTVSPPVVSNIRDFLFEKLKIALPKHNDSDKSFRIYRIFMLLVQTGSGIATPRQIVSFINDLTGVYTLHSGRFGLPTIAIFIALRSKLENDPEYLRDIENISKLALLANDYDLEKNLAALTFNVEPELAFQILLDDQIHSAAVAEDSEKLEELSNAPGFEDRVVDVVDESAEDWIQSEEYYAAVKNFAELNKIYTGNAKEHFCSKLISVFPNAQAIDFNVESYTQYLAIFQICRPEASDELLREFISKISTGLKNIKVLKFEHGKNLTTLLSGVNNNIDRIGKSDILNQKYSNLALPNVPEFIFGFASNVHNSQAKLSDFNIVDINKSEDSEENQEDEYYWEKMAIQAPSNAIHAFKEFNSVSYLGVDQWVSIVNSISQNLRSESDYEESKFSDQIKLICQVFCYIESSRRAEINLIAIFQSNQFYQSLDNEQYDLTNPESGYLLYLISYAWIQNEQNSETAISIDDQISVQNNYENLSKIKNLLVGTDALSIVSHDVV